MMLYTPGGVVALVLIAPVAGFKAMPTGKAGLLASILTSELTAVAATPLTVSLARTLAIGVEAAPAVALPLSVAAMITGVKVLM